MAGLFTLAWLPSGSSMLSYGRISCFLKAEWQSIVCIYHTCFILSSIYGHSCCFHILSSKSFKEKGKYPLQKGCDPAICNPAAARRGAWGVGRGAGLGVLGVGVPPRVPCHLTDRLIVSFRLHSFSPSVLLLSPGNPWWWGWGSKTAVLIYYTYSTVKPRLLWVTF